MLRSMAPCRIQSVLRNERSEKRKSLTPSNGPAGYPTKRRSKKRDGMMKKERSYQVPSVKSTVAKEMGSIAAPSSSGGTR